MLPTATGMFPANLIPIAAGEEFRWFRSRILGGRTNHYGRISLRFSDYDFKPQAFDGLGFDWPAVTYDEMSPWYDKAEEIHRRHWNARKAFAPRPMANSSRPSRRARSRNTCPARRQEAQQSCDPVAYGHADEGHSRARRLPLLWTMRARLSYGLGVHVQPGHDLPRHEDRETEHHHRRDGPRAHRQ